MSDPKMLLDVSLKAFSLTPSGFRKTLAGMNLI